MGEKVKTLLLVLVLGTLLPNLIFSGLSRKQKAVPITAVVSETVGQQPTAATVQTISVLDDTGNIQQIPLNAYLTDVVLCEMPAEFESEALKAQAVVARTYALRRSKSGSKHKSAAVCMDPSCCQGYKSTDEYLSSGGNRKDVEKVRNAVDATDNMVLTYNGELIEATYFSCSGGRTEDAREVWGSDIPYLQSTQSPGEEGATHFTDTVTFTTKEFAAKLGCELPDKQEPWVENIVYTSGGGVKSIRLCGKDFSGTTVRQLLDLRSTAFVITVVGETVTITTRGFGHRVGMSQYGADAMALDGKDYEQILLHYYQGVELVEYVAND